MNTADDIKRIIDNENLLKEKTKIIFEKEDIDKSNFLDLSEIKNVMDELCKESRCQPRTPYSPYMGLSWTRGMRVLQI